MTTTLVGLYDRPETAGRVVDDLARAGCDRRDISSIAPARATRLATSELAGQDLTHIDGVGDVRARGPLRDRLRGHPPSGLVEALVDWGIAPADADLYAQGLRYGESLVVARVGDGLSATAADVMRRHGPQRPAT